MLSFLRKRERDSEMEAELASHVELAVEENMRQGMPEAEARRKALVRFGGVQQTKERQREARGLPWLDVLMQDVRYTLRTLRRDRSFTVVAVLILALGIGANIAVFSVVNTILLRPLPFPDSQRLVRITTKDPKGGDSSMTYTTDATQEYQQRNKSFQHVTGYFAFSSYINYKLGGHGVPLPVTGMLVMGNFFQTLEVQPLLGRVFTADECLPKGRAAVLLSYPFWKRQFHGDRGIVGQAIDLNGTPVTVVGVMPKTFDFGSVFSPGLKVDIFTPFIMHDFQDDGNVLALMGRLKPGVTLASAQAEADLLFPKLDASLRNPGWHANYTGRQVLLKQYVTGKLHRSLIVLWCAVGMILLIVCVNLSNLLSGANGGAQQGICDADCAGSGARPVDSAVADGEPDPFRSGCVAGTGNCVCGDRISIAPGIDCAASVERSADRWCNAGVDGGDCDCEWGGVWAYAGAEDVVGKSAGDAERFRQRRRRRQKA